MLGNVTFSYIKLHLVTCLHEGSRDAIFKKKVTNQCLALTPLDGCFPFLPSCQQTNSSAGIPDAAQSLPILPQSMISRF